MNTISDKVKAITVKNRPDRNFLKKRTKVNYEDSYQNYS